MLPPQCARQLAYSHYITLSTLLWRSVVYQFTNTESQNAETKVTLIYIYGICIDTQLNIKLMDLHECVEKFKESEIPFER